MKSADVLILGAGVVGLTAALHLTQNGISVRVFDKILPDPQSDRSDIDPRVFAIMPKNQRYFTELGIWDAIAHDRISPYRTMHVWETDVNKGITFAANDMGQPVLGHIIEQRVILRALLDACRQQPHFCLQAPTELLDVSINAEEAVVKTEQGEFTGKLIIGADGPQSWLRSQQKFALTQWDYQQHAIVATVTTELSHQQCARQRFTPSGPLAFLPLQDPHRCSIVYAQDKQKALELMTLTDNEFIEELNRAFSNTLGAITSISKRLSYPLQMRHVKRYVDARIALIGDAAHTLHPLAGVGMNLGLLDAAELCQTILHTKQLDHDIGAYHHLRPYERARKGHNWSMIALMEGFKRLFGTDLTPVTLLRNWGLQRVDSLQVIKNKMMQSFN